MLIGYNSILSHEKANVNTKSKTIRKIFQLRINIAEGKSVGADWYYYLILSSKRIILLQNDY